jgi:hypothetical protein
MDRTQFQALSAADRRDALAVVAIPVTRRTRLITVEARMNNESQTDRTNEKRPLHRVFDQGASEGGGFSAAVARTGRPQT